MSVEDTQVLTSEDIKEILKEVPEEEKDKDGNEEE